MTREIFRQRAINKFVKYEIQPGETLQSDDELDSFISQNVESAYHPCGTCKMGVDPKYAVVDEKLRVHGVQRLRVVDASVFPLVPTGNTNGPTIAVAEKAATMIIKDAIKGGWK